MRIPLVQEIIDLDVRHLPKDIVLPRPAFLVPELLFCYLAGYHDWGMTPPAPPVEGGASGR
jgi:hypothetical protein